MDYGNKDHVCAHNHYCTFTKLVPVYTQDERGHDKLWKVDNDQYQVYRCPHCGAMYLLP